MFKRSACGSQLTTPEDGVGTYLVCERRAGHRGQHHTLFESWTDDDVTPARDQGVHAVAIPKQRDTEPMQPPMKADAAR